MVHAKDAKEMHAKAVISRTAVLLVAVALSQIAFCQRGDSIAAAKHHRFARAMTAPVALFGAGMAVRSYNQKLHNFFVKSPEVEYKYPKLSSHISDYTQFAPIALVYSFHLFGNKGEHTALKSFSMLLQSELLIVAMVRPLKHFTNELRPDGGTLSFPSGHTAQAFLAATFLHKEYGHKSVWYSIGGYALATAVGTCRMTANRHWPSDVLVGAGLGILSTNLVYLFHKHRKANVTAVPSYTRGSAGFYISMKL